MKSRTQRSLTAKYPIYNFKNTLPQNNTTGICAYLRPVSQIGWCPWAWGEWERVLGRRKKKYSRQVWSLELTGMNDDNVQRSEE